MAIVTHNNTDTRLGLEWLNANKVDASGLYRRRERESHRRHPSLIQHYSKQPDRVFPRPRRV